MGHMSNTLPINLTTVSALGAGQELTDNYDGVVNDDYAGVTGFIPASGTLKLSDFVDATKVNCRSNIFYNIHATGESGTVTGRGMLSFLANGSIEFHNNSSAPAANITTITGNASYQDSDRTTHYAQEWLLNITNPCLSTTANNWEIKIARTAGNIAAPTNNNTWQAFPVQFPYEASQVGVGSTARVITMNLQFRRNDTDEVVHTGNIRLELAVTRFFDG